MDGEFHESSTMGHDLLGLTSGLDSVSNLLELDLGHESLFSSGLGIDDVLFDDSLIDYNIVEVGKSGLEDDLDLSFLDGLIPLAPPPPRLPDTFEDQGATPSDLGNFDTSDPLTDEPSDHGTSFLSDNVASRNPPHLGSLRDSRTPSTDCLGKDAGIGCGKYSPIRVSDNAVSLLDDALMLANLSSTSMVPSKNIAIPSRSDREGVSNMGVHGSSTSLVNDAMVSENPCSTLRTTMKNIGIQPAHIREEDIGSSANSTNLINDAMILANISNTDLKPVKGIGIPSHYDGGLSPMTVQNDSANFLIDAFNSKNHDTTSLSLNNAETPHPGRAGKHGFIETTHDITDLQRDNTVLASLSTAPLGSLRTLKSFARSRLEKGDVHYDNGVLTVIEASGNVSHLRDDNVISKSIDETPCVPLGTVDDKANASCRSPLHEEKDEQKAEACDTLEIEADALVVKTSRKRKRSHVKKPKKPKKAKKVKKAKKAKKAKSRKGEMKGVTLLEKEGPKHYKCNTCGAVYKSHELCINHVLNKHKTPMTINHRLSRSLSKCAANVHLPHHARTKCLKPHLNGSNARVGRDSTRLPKTMKNHVKYIDSHIKTSSNITESSTSKNNVTQRQETSAKVKSKSENKCRRTYSKIKIQEKSLKSAPPQCQQTSGQNQNKGITDPKRKHYQRVRTAPALCKHDRNTNSQCSANEVKFQQTSMTLENNGKSFNAGSRCVVSKSIGSEDLESSKRILIVNASSRKEKRPETLLIDASDYKRTDIPSQPQNDRIRETVYFGGGLNQCNKTSIRTVNNGVKATLNKVSQTAHLVGSQTNDITETTGNRRLGEQEGTACIPVKNCGDTSQGNATLCALPADNRSKVHLETVNDYENYSTHCNGTLPEVDDDSEIRSKGKDSETVFLSKIQHKSSSETNAGDKNESARLEDEFIVDSRRNSSLLDLLPSAQCKAKLRTMDDFVRTKVQYGNGAAMESENKGDIGCRTKECKIDFQLNTQQENLDLNAKQKYCSTKCQRTLKTLKKKQIVTSRNNSQAVVFPSSQPKSNLIKKGVKRSGHRHLHKISFKPESKCIVVSMRKESDIALPHYNQQGRDFKTKSNLLQCKRKSCNQQIEWAAGSKRTVSQSILPEKMQCKQNLHTTGSRRNESTLRHKISFRPESKCVVVSMRKDYKSHPKMQNKKKEADSVGRRFQLQSERKSNTLKTKPVADSKRKRSPKTNQKSESITSTHNMDTSSILPSDNQREISVETTDDCGGDVPQFHWLSFSQESDCIISMRTGSRNAHPVSNKEGKNLEANMKNETDPQQHQQKLNNLQCKLDGAQSDCDVTMSKDPRVALQDGNKKENMKDQSDSQQCQQESSNLQSKPDIGSKRKRTTRQEAIKRMVQTNSSSKKDQNLHTLLKGSKECEPEDLGGELVDESSDLNMDEVPKASIPPSNKLRILSHQKTDCVVSVTKAIQTNSSRNRESFSDPKEEISVDGAKLSMNLGILSQTHTNRHKSDPQKKAETREKSCVLQAKKGINVDRSERIENLNNFSQTSPAHHTSDVQKGASTISEVQTDKEKDAGKLKVSANLKFSSNVDSEHLKLDAQQKSLLISINSRNCVGEREKKNYDRTRESLQIRSFSGQAEGKCDRAKESMTMNTTHLSHCDIGQSKVDAQRKSSDIVQSKVYAQRKSSDIGQSKVDAQRKSSDKLSCFIQRETKQTAEGYPNKNNSVPCPLNAQSKSSMSSANERNDLAQMEIGESIAKDASLSKRVCADNTYIGVRTEESKNLRNSTKMNLNNGRDDDQIQNLNEDVSQKVSVGVRIGRGRPKGSKNRKGRKEATKKKTKEVARCSERIVLRPDPKQLTIVICPKCQKAFITYSAYSSHVNLVHNVSSSKLPGKIKQVLVQRTPQYCSKNMAAQSDSLLNGNGHLEDDFSKQKKLDGSVSFSRHLLDQKLQGASKSFGIGTASLNKTTNKDSGKGISAENSPQDIFQTMDVIATALSRASPENFHKGTISSGSPQADTSGAKEISHNKPTEDNLGLVEQDVAYDIPINGKTKDLCYVNSEKTGDNVNKAEGELVPHITSVLNNIPPNDHVHGQSEKCQDFASMDSTLSGTTVLENAKPYLLDLQGHEQPNEKETDTVMDRSTPTISETEPWVSLMCASCGMVFENPNILDGDHQFGATPGELMCQWTAPKEVPPDIEEPVFVSYLCSTCGAYISSDADASSHSAVCGVDFDESSNLGVNQHPLEPGLVVSRGTGQEETLPEGACLCPLSGSSLSSHADCSNHSCKAAMSVGVPPKRCTSPSKPRTGIGDQG